MKKHNWKKGSIHCHTLWSDGRNMPETAIWVYQQNGYDFVCLSDHNFSQQDPARWMEVRYDEGHWPPNLTRAEWERCQKIAPGMVETKIGGYRTYVKLNTLTRLRELFERKNEFLLVAGVEITTSFKGYESNPEGCSRACHMNVFNLELPPFEEPKGTVFDIVDQGLAMFQKGVEKSGSSSFFMMNHPQYHCWDIDPTIMLAYPQIKFFEVCNSGSNSLRKVDIPITIESYWDFILAHRLDRGEGLLYGVASDDAHFHVQEEGSGDACTGFVVVDCGEDFSYNGIAEAMLRGDFYASTGVMLQEISFDKETKTLSLKVDAKPGSSYKIKFITTRKDFDRTIRKEFYKGEEVFYDRESTVIPENIGNCVKEVEGVSASYTMTEEDLYVRAVIISDVPGRFPGRPVYPETEQAWTQPFC